MKDFFTESEMTELNSLADKIQDRSMIEQSMLLAHFIINAIGNEKMMRLASTGIYLDWYATHNPMTCKTIERQESK